LLWPSHGHTKTDRLKAKFRTKMFLWPIARLTPSRSF